MNITNLNLFITLNLIPKNTIKRGNIIKSPQRSNSKLARIQVKFNNETHKHYTLQQHLQF